MIVMATSIHLTAGSEEICYLGHGDEVSHVRFAGGGRPPVHLQLPLLKNLLHLVFPQNLLKHKQPDGPEAELRGGLGLCRTMSAPAGSW